MTILPWWNSAKAARNASRVIALIDVIGLGILTAFEALAWRYFESHHKWEEGGWITLGVLTVLGLIAWFYGNRAEDLRDKEDAAKDARHQAEIDATKFLIPLSKDAKKILRQTFADCGAQILVQVDQDEDEAHPLAIQIAECCPRYGTKAFWALPRPPDAPPLPPGVGIAAGPKQDDPEWADKITRKFSAGLKAAGIPLSNSQARLNPKQTVAEGFIEINVGPRPPA